MRLVLESKSLEGDQNKKIPCPQKGDLFCFVFSTLWIFWVNLLA